MRDGEAEQTMMAALKVFKEPQLVKGLEILYEDPEEDAGHTSSMRHSPSLHIAVKLPFPSTPWLHCNLTFTKSVGDDVYAIAPFVVNCACVKEGCSAGQTLSSHVQSCSNH